MDRKNARPPSGLPDDIGLLLTEIAAEPAPERLLLLARQLQAALAGRPQPMPAIGGHAGADERTGEFGREYENGPSDIRRPSAGWTSLSAEQQAQVREVCASMDTASAATATDLGGSTSGGASTDTTAGGTAGTTPDEDVTTSSTTDASAEGENMASMTQLCGWVGDEQ